MSTILILNTRYYNSCLYLMVLEKSIVVETVKGNTPNLIFSPIWLSLKQKKRAIKLLGYSIEYSFVWPIHILFMNK